MAILKSNLLTETLVDAYRTVREGLRGGLASNAAWLYAVHFANYLVPLVMVPYVARVLGPRAWGLVAFTQAFGQYFILIVEYGFNLSATREIARCRGSLERRADLLAGVLGAKVVLAFLGLVVAFVVSHWVPIFRIHPEMLWSGVFWALATAFNLTWYFQGLERMRLAATVDITSKTVALIGVLVVVRGPTDGWKVLGLMGLASLFSTLAGVTLAYREIPVRLPNRVRVSEALRLGWSMFLFRGAVSLYTVGNAFLLGLFAPPQIVGYYAGAEKLSKALLGVLGPIMQTLYPRTSYLVRHSPTEAAGLVRAGLWVMGLGGCSLGLMLLVLAPFAVRIFLGEGYDPAVPVVRILSLLVPLIALSNVLGIQWMVPLGFDRSFNSIILGAGLINLTLALLLAPHFLHVGMAVAVVISETFVTSAIWWVLHRRNMSPFALEKK
ncbi:flippase [uncultured Thermanaerothrix sp.]|uniref:flippase n=1 Tax=uncultured Thermanaerothrix sp. TaxID=1195149 RepID=UPI00262F35F3|nr:flippase [uncultured Thermanaerothrix sp.]